jgi:hypothetical protein
VVNATTITAKTPAGTTGNASVLVTTPNGTNPANTLYTYLNNVCVAGAGTTTYNGTYEILDNGNYQKTGSPSIAIYFDSEYSEWVFYSSDVGYYASGSSTTLPLTGWIVYGNGTAPAPTITVGACS